MFNKLLYVKKILVSIAIVSFVVGCSVGKVTAPDQSTIQISPPSFTTTSGTFTTPHATWFTITVYDPSGTPMNGVDINISAKWATPDAANAVQLYNGETAVNSPFSETTDDNGTYILKLVYLAGSTEWTGGIEVRSGTAFQSAEIAISEQ